jgi:outer membrane cobalamin receptor
MTAVSDRWTTNAHLQGTRVDGYYEVGASAYRRFHVGRGVMECRVDVKNLTDKQYEIVGAYPMPGRSYQVTINYRL